MGKQKAGCVPVRRRAPNSDEWDVLLVQSRWTPEVWLFPKGTIEDNESGKQAAVRETVEEGGVAGELGPKIGTWVIQKGSKTKQKMWILFVSTEYGADNKNWKERKKRLRAWYSLQEAKQIFTGISEDLQRPELVDMLEEAKKILNQIGTGPIPPQAEGSSQPSGATGDSD